MVVDRADKGFAAGAGIEPGGPEFVAGQDVRADAEETLGEIATAQELLKGVFKIRTQGTEGWLDYPRGDGRGMGEGDPSSLGRDVARCNPHSSPGFFPRFDFNLNGRTLVVPRNEGMAPVTVLPETIPINPFEIVFELIAGMRVIMRMISCQPLVISGLLVLSGALITGSLSAEDDPFSHLALIEALARLPPVPAFCAQEDPHPPFPYVTGSLELRKGERTRTWAIRMDLGDSEQVNRAPDNSRIVHSSTGREFVFSNLPRTMTTRLWGPYDATAPENPGAPKSNRITVNESNLRLGLNRVDGFFAAMGRYTDRYVPETRLSYTWQSEPVPEDQRILSPDILREIGLDAETEKAFVGGPDALLEFFQLINSTESLRDILLEMIPKRRFIGMLNPFSSRSIGLSFGQPPPFRVPAGSLLPERESLGVLPLLLEMNNRPILDITLFTTDPSKGWETSAGVVALHARSSADPETQFFLRFETEIPR